MTNETSTGTNPTMARQVALAQAVRKLNAERSEIPGLWTLNGCIEVTENQLLQIAEPHP